MRKFKHLLLGIILVTPLSLSSLFTLQSALAVPSSLASRIGQYKAEHANALPTLSQARVKLRCKAAQGKVRSLSGRIKGIQTSRTEVYKNITDQLAGLQTRLQQKDINTTELQAQLAELRLKIDGYKTDLNTYKQAVVDLGALDCTADPAAFKAALMTARDDLQVVSKDVTTIHTYITGTVRATLVKLHDKVKATQ